MLRTESGTQEMRITRLWPHTDLKAVWKNIGEAPVSETNRAAWYKAIHDILQKHGKLHKISILPRDKCGNCATVDTVEHRLTERDEGNRIWDWARQRLARMLRTLPERIPVEWLMRPQFNI